MLAMYLVLLSRCIARCQLCCDPLQLDLQIICRIP